jgi:enamine deaminase RidA (YjgF/YER057c/UK114 family)
MRAGANPKCERVGVAHFPTMSLVQIVALVEDEARAEIEATTVVPK